MWLRSCRRQRVARAEWMLPGAGSPEREQPIVTQLELRAYVPTCLRAYVPTCLRAYVPTCLRAYVATGRGCAGWRSRAQ